MGDANFVSRSEPDDAPSEKAEHRCGQGHVLRWLEWGSRSEKCAGAVCPHPIICPVKLRAEINLSLPKPEFVDMGKTMHRGRHETG